MTENLIDGDDLLADLTPPEDPAEAQDKPADEPSSQPQEGEVLPGAELDASGDTLLAFSAKKFVLQVLFEKASTCIPNKDVMPVLKNFQVEASLEGLGALRVVATDLELSVVASSSLVAIEKPGVAVFPAKKILEIIREAEDEEVRIKITTDNVAEVFAGNTSWKLKLEPGDDYPPIPEVSEMQLTAVDRVKFLGAIQSVRYAAATESTRQSLMMISIDEGTMTACDGVRFQRALIEDFDQSLQLPIGAVDDLVKLLRSTDLTQIGVGVDEHHLVFKIGDDVFIANQLMVSFPDVEDLLLRPAMNNKKLFVVDHEELGKAVKRVRINADKETSAIVLNLSAGTVEVATRDKFGNSSSESLTAQWDYEERQVVVNHKFLADMLSMYDGKSCTFKLGEDTKSRKCMVMLTDEATGSVGIIQQMRPEWTT